MAVVFEEVSAEIDSEPRGDRAASAPASAGPDPMAELPEALERLTRLLDERRQRLSAD